MLIDSLCWETSAERRSQRGHFLAPTPLWLFAEEGQERVLKLLPLHSAHVFLRKEETLPAKISFLWKLRLGRAPLARQTKWAVRQPLSWIPGRHQTAEGREAPGWIRLPPALDSQAEAALIALQLFIFSPSPSPALLALLPADPAEPPLQPQGNLPILRRSVKGFWTRFCQPLQPSPKSSSKWEEKGKYWGKKDSSG